MIEPTPRPGGLLKRLLGRPGASWVIVALALALCSPSLFSGLGADDLIHELMLREHPGIEGFSHRPFDLFAFATGDLERNHKLMDEGVFPWWAHPRVVLSFFRPISSATHYVDHLLWPNRPVLMHLHSMAWFALLLYIVGAIYRRFASSPWVANLALLLYAVDDARATVVGWVANRNAIVALALSLPALIAYDKWRRENVRWCALLGPIMFGVGLFAGEAALLVGTYLVAYAVFFDEGTGRARLARLGPYVAVLIGWRILYVYLGYGSIQSGIYFDPARAPLDFLHAALTRLPVLVLGQFALPWSDFWDIYPLILPSGRAVVLVLAALVMGGLVALLAPLCRRDRSCRFWALGCLASIGIMCSTFPHDRLLTAPGIGGMALVAELLGAVVEATYPTRTWPASVGAAALAFIHLVVGPLLAPYRARAMNDINRMLGDAYQSIPSTDAISNKSVVLVNPPLDPFAAYFLIYREAAHQPRPRRLRWLTTGVSDIRIDRVDASTLRVRPSAGFLASSTELMLRNLAEPMRAGERVLLSDATFEISEVGPDGRPREVLVRFRVELEDRSLEWMQWGRHGYVPFRVPGIGETVIVPSVDMRQVLLERS